jgi:hypothetical protein
MRCALRPLDSSLSWSHSWVTESPSYGTESLALADVIFQDQIIRDF